MTSSIIHRKRYRIRWSTFISRLVLLGILSFGLTWIIGLMYGFFGDIIKDKRSPIFGISTSRVVVQPGDSLWSIASDLELAGSTDRRRVVEDIRQLNGLPLSSVLTPGTSLIVPSMGDIDPDVAIASAAHGADRKRRIL